jgi:signal transduction histidine kinase
MLISSSFDLSEEIQADIGRKIIFFLLFFFVLLSISLSDAIPVQNALYAMPFTTLSLLGIVVVTLLLIPKGFAVYRWVPLMGLILLTPTLFFTYRQTGLLFLIPFTVLITPILVSFGAGLSLAVLETGLIFLLSKTFNFSHDFTFFAVLNIWLILGVLTLFLGIIRETIASLHKQYNENLVLLKEAQEKQGILNQLVKERTDANIKLARMNQLANHLTQIAENERKIKEEFVARVSHELRTPLNMIIGFCTVLIESNEERVKRLPQSVVEDLEIILRNSKHLSQLINDILDLSQINAGQMAIVKEETSLQEIIAEAVSSVKSLFESRHLSLQTEIQPDLPNLSCDRTRIVEVLLNLLSNAGRYTNQGGVTIRAIRKGQSLEIEVIDTGIGIPKQKQERLFDPFYQVDGSIRRKYGGTGLGLSISKSIVELHNGRMWVESEEGKGTAFIFQLPIQSAGLNQGSARRWFNPYQGEAQSPSHPMGLEEQLKPRIVTVDPDGDFTHMLRRYMSQGEYIPTATLSQGIAEVNQAPSQLLLINTGQISTDFEQLRGSESLPFSTPAIFCSIPTSQQVKARWDIYDILVKPISQKLLVGSIENLGPGVKTVLVVDDDPDTRRMLKRMLSQKNKAISVVTASNGSHAFRVMKRQAVDAILLDLVMPKMDGYQFLEKKKTLLEYKDIPVILISAHQVHEQSIMSDGMGVFVRGGLTIQQFIQCLYNLSATLAS